MSMPIILAVYILTSSKQCLIPPQKYTSFFLLLKMKSGAKIFSTVLYVVFLHDTVDLKYFFTVLSMIVLHDAYLATN